MFRRYVVIPAVLAVGLAGAAAIVIADPLVPVRPATIAEKNEIRLRASFGLTTDLSAVRAIDATNPLSSFGFAMSDHERAEFRGRSRVGQFANPVDSVVSKNSSYAGLWLEQKGFGAIDIGWTTKPPSAVVDAAEAIVPKGVPIRFVREKYTFAELTALQDQISSVMVPGAGGLEINSAGVDVIGNRVDATVAHRSDVDRVYARFGRARLHVTVGQPSTAATG